MGRQLTFVKAINEALTIAMEADNSVICYGLGVSDPKGIFSTTLGLEEKFGKERVFDIPSSENAMTGVAIGASMNGIRPVMTHQRLEFFLLAMDQLVNSAAKWHYMFDGNASIPITIRLIVGQGWGNGPTHSQNLQAWFAHIPGIKVIMPATAADAKGLLLSSIFDNNPVIFIEHRWLHNLQGEVQEGDFRIPLGEAKEIKTGNDFTIVSMSHMTIEALQATEILEEHGISIDLIDLRTVKPIDWEKIFSSVRKTGRLLALDSGTSTGSIASEIIARVSMECHESLKVAPERLALPDFPIPTSFSLTKDFFNKAEDIIDMVAQVLGKNLNGRDLLDRKDLPHDVPGDWFKGPF